MVKTIESLEQFKEVVNSGKPVIVDFWADWCGPCKMMNTPFADLATKYESTVEFYKCNIDEHEDIAQCTDPEVKVTSIPLFVMYKDGKRVNAVLGARPPQLQQLADTAASLAN